jgi:hypothetical protein
MTSLLFVIGMPNVTRRRWSIGGVEFAVNRLALVRAAELLSSRFHGKSSACGANTGVVFAICLLT